MLAEGRTHTADCVFVDGVWRCPEGCPWHALDAFLAQPLTWSHEQRHELRLAGRLAALRRGQIPA